MPKLSLIYEPAESIERMQQRPVVVVVASKSVRKSSFHLSNEKRFWSCAKKDVQSRKSLRLWCGSQNSLRYKKSWRSETTEIQKRESKQKFSKIRINQSSIKPSKYGSTKQEPSICTSLMILLQLKRKFVMISFLQGP